MAESTKPRGWKWEKFEEQLIYDGDSSGSGWSMDEGDQPTRKILNNDEQPTHDVEMADEPEEMELQPTQPPRSQIEREATTRAQISASTKVKRVIASIQNLNIRERKFVACEMRDICPKGTHNTILKYWQKSKRQAGRQIIRVNRIQKRKVKSSIRKSAWFVPLIFKGDKIPQNGKLFLDIEDIDLKLAKTIQKQKHTNDELKYEYDSKHMKVPATVAIINEAGQLVLWAFISWPKYQVCQYFTSLTGLSWRQQKKGISLQLLHQLLKLCLPGNLLVGFAIKNDMQVLKFHHDRVEDLQDFHAFNDGIQPYSLKTLAKVYLDEDSFQAREHSAIKDARITRALYNCKRAMTSDPDNNPPKAVVRMPRDAFRKTKGDFCRCYKKSSDQHLRDIRITSTGNLEHYFLYKSDSANSRQSIA